jgi:tetratricopeptide (TPR) repeat protein
MLYIFKINWPLRVLLVVMLCFAHSPLLAQDATTQPADDAEREMTVDELDTLLNSMTPEQLAELMNAAMVLRLEQERSQVAAEIKGGLLYEPKDIAAAVKILKDKPANTQQDNIERICKALAKVDVLFGKAYGQMLKKDYKAAAASAAKVVDDQRATYLSAATFYIYAQCLVGSDRGEDAVEVYREILINMPDRLSFASSASLEAAKVYEKINRLQYAMEMYAYCLENYALTLTEKEAESIYQKIKEFAEVYKEPFKALATKMGYVETRLAAEDSGKKTQKKEKEILALLEDMIKTAEEKASRQPPPPPKCTCGGKGTCKACKAAKKPGKDKGEDKGKGPGKGQGKDPKGDNPSSPAKVSALVPGKAARPPRDASAHKNAGDGDWSTLPPREQERIRQMLRKLISERHKDITSKYHSALTKTPTDK